MVCYLGCDLALGGLGERLGCGFTSGREEFGVWPHFWLEGLVRGVASHLEGRSLGL